MDHQLPLLPQLSCWQSATTAAAVVCRHDPALGVGEQYLQAYTLGARWHRLQLEECDGDSLYGNPDPMIRMGFRHGLQDQDAAEDSNMTDRQLQDIAEQLIVHCIAMAEHAASWRVREIQGMGV